MICEILAVGTELLMGMIANTNAQYISRRLPEAGAGVYYHSVVGDNPDRIKLNLKIASDRSNIVIITGGLGPTKDDLTKEIVSEFLGRKLVLNKIILEKIEGYFKSLDRTMTDNNRKQAYFPENSIIVENPNGTAPGCIIEDNGKTFILLPGPPSEMIPMMDQSVIPYISKKCGGEIYSKFVRLFGIGESSMEKEIIHLIEHQSNPTIAPYVNEGEITLRITALAKTPQKAEDLMKPLLDELYKKLGVYIYTIGNEDLKAITCRLLMENDIKISTAESCTGGMIASNITEIPGISKIFGMGIVAYSNEAKIDLLGVKASTLDDFGAVSSQVAEEMALGVLNRSESDIGISVTGIAGPDGGTAEKPVGLVYIGLAYKDGKNKIVKSKKFIFKGERQKIRIMTALNVFDIILKYIKSRYSIEEGKQS
ncbi:MAG TPA: competence/damage-inducible protein A [Clostridia bacterium]|nr:competence/damage-inducible protein A [Clostridia bacterium]